MAEVAIIGAGMAGLAAARTLRKAGESCEIFEASGEVGGCVRSENIGDIRVDRGFQVFNSWYPAVKEILSPGEYSSLEIKSFKPAIRTLTSDGLALIADPIRAPHLIPAFLRTNFGSALSLKDVYYLQRWVRSELSHRSSLELRTVKDARLRKDISVRESLDQARVTGSLRKNVIDPLLRAFTYDTDGETSAFFAKWLIVTLLRGTLAVPEQGMGELAHVMGKIPGVDIHLNSPVEDVRIVESATKGRVNLQVNGEKKTFDYAISALPPREEARLLGFRERRMRGVSTWWLVAPEKLDGQPVITVDGCANTALSSVADITSASPTYAPGRGLIAANVVHGPAGVEGLPGDSEVMTGAGKLLGVDASGWEVLTRHDIPDAMPVLSPTMTIKRGKELELLGDRLAVAGVQHATPTVDGAIRSGQRAAKQIIEQLQR